MLEDKKKLYILGICIVILFISAMVYYVMQKKEEDYFIWENIENVEQKNEMYVEEEIEEKKKATIVVHISGEVVKEGVISLEEGARVIDAIEQAGGLTQDADISKVNLAYVLADAQKIYIPSVKDKEELPIITSDSSFSIRTEESGIQKENVMVNINTANVEELQELPGIGSSIAEKIVAYRKENGKFNTIEDIQNVSGIGNSKFNKIKNNICVK